MAMIDPAIITTMTMAIPDFRKVLPARPLQ